MYCIVNAVHCGSGWEEGYHFCPVHCLRIPTASSTTCWDRTNPHLAKDGLSVWKTVERSAGKAKLYNKHKAAVPLCCLSQETCLISLCLVACSCLFALCLSFCLIFLSPFLSNLYLHICRYAYLDHLKGPSIFLSIRLFTHGACIPYLVRLNDK